MGKSVPLVWLLSPYRADSHAAWADWLVDSQRQVDWRRLELPGRHFAWRIRGNPLSWLDSLPTEQPDLLLATSMTDLAALKGLHPRLAGVPCIYYFHENQFAYPRSRRQLDTVEPQMVQLYGGLCADRLLFNSAFNRDSYLQGVEMLLGQMPDAVPAGVPERLAAKSAICPVPIEALPATEKDPGLILWNHRWEYDKDPELFARAVLALAEEGGDFRLALLGARSRQKTPKALGLLRERLGKRIVADGKVSREEYRAILGRASIAVSTARHEFQGLAMLEAASAGARPLVPDALCYPEQFADAYRYRAGDLGALTARLRRWLDGDLPPPVDVSAWHADRLKPLWQGLLSRPGRNARGNGLSAGSDKASRQSGGPGRRSQLAGSSR